jgi:hypothetical protein
MISKNTLLIFLWVTVAPLAGYSQTVEYIWNPDFSYSWKSSDRLGFVSKTNLFTSLKDLDNRNAIYYGESLLSFSYGLTVRTKIGGGYLFRLAQPLDLDENYAHEHRLMQQVVLVRYIGDNRLSHRFRAEQRFRTRGYLNRLRYRLSYDFPLDGERLDPGEPYAVLSNEILTNFNLSLFEGENRVVAGLGWLLNSKNKIELGLEYRLAKVFTSGEVGHLFLFSTAFYINR